MSPTWLVTGASGFVGQALCAALHVRGIQVRAALRKPVVALPCSEQSIISTLDQATDWSAALKNVATVVHLAARVHVMHDAADDPLIEFCRTNTLGTENLAHQAAAAGVKRLVYVSSIKVNGEETLGDRHYSEQDMPAPQDPYGLSKWEAEQALQRVARGTGLEVAIVRPPLVYGPGVKGNFAQMLGVLGRRLPLPLAAIRNQRDLIYLGNLVDALILCATHPKAANQTYLVRDGEPVSTPELLRCLGEVMGKPARLFPCPVALLELAGRLTGKSAQIDRLTGSLQIDDAKIRRELGWHPPFTLQEGLKATVAGH